MELSESDSISVPIISKDSELGFKSAIISPALKPCSNPNLSPDLDHAADTHDSLPKEFQNKLELKENGDEQMKKGGGVEDENDLKVSNFSGGFGEETLEKVEEGVDYGGADSGWGENVYEDSGWTEDVGWNDNERRFGEFGDDGAVFGDDVDNKYERSNGDSMYQYPVRPEAEDCAFYIKTGTCKFGSNCKFNHPLRRKNQVYKGKVRGNEESTERSSQTECKYHLSSGGCKYGQACRYNHTGMRSSPAPAPPLELNFLGLPIRLGEKECPYYMRNGSCKYGASCKFNHPDPTVGGGGDSPSAYSNGGCLPLQGVTQDSVATWSTPVTLTEAPPFVPLMPLPNQVVSHRSPEWNGYQPVYVPQRNMGPSAPYVMNSPTAETKAYGHLQQQMQVEEFPERPGEPDCSYFLKTGNCKFKSNCKFHHPKNRAAITPPCTLNDKGLPLRPEDFEGLLATDYGFKPQGKSAPMAASKGSSTASGSTLNFDLGSRGPSRSMGNSNLFGGSFTNDGDSIFGSLGNQENQDTGGIGDLFGGSAFARYTIKSETNAAESPFNLDSMYRASSDTGSKCTSAPPVFDKPLYDDDIFEGVPGLKNSAKVNYDDVFASVASDTASKYTSAPPEPGSGAAAISGGNDAFDDLLGGFSKVHREHKSSDRKRVDEDDNGVAGFEDLLPGVGSSRAPSGSSTSDPTMSPQPSVSSAKKMSDEADDPFKVFESASIPHESLSAQFIDPLEEISRLSHSKSTKLDSSSVSNANVYDDFDPFEGLGESVSAFSSEMTDSKDRNPSRTDTGTARTPTDTNSSEKSSIRSPARRSQNMTHVDRDPDFSYGSFSKTAYSSNGNTFKESNFNVDMSPKDEGKLESDDDVWLVVSEIPLVTQPTAAPPPTRPPPPRSLHVPKSELGSASHTNTRKANESSFSASTQYSQAPRSAPVAARVPAASPFDELDDFATGRSHGGGDELANGVSGEELEMNTVAAAMKEAMDRAEAKFRHAKGVREREGTKATRRETVPLEREEKSVHEERQKQERLRLQKEREEKESIEKEREEEEKERRRLERERERVKELERERARARQAVEKVTREARERAAVEARTRAERAAAEKANAEARERAQRAAVQRAQAEARERAAAEAKGRAEKAASEARERANTEARTENEVRLRAERAAVERAAAEARERAAAAASKMNQQKHDNDLESFFSTVSRPSSAPRPRTNSSDVSDNPFQNRQEPSVAKRSGEASSSIRKTSSANFVDDLSSIFGAAPSSGEFKEVEGETEERRRARLERHQRTLERAAKALAEKNERDLQTQRDQAERHRIAETLDNEIKRWAAGKEGNLRALLSTLQYVLWPECGWQSVSLTDLITGASVKKVYRKATLCIHPDKVQQKGANLQQKYIAEKVFDLLKEAWNKFNSEELF